MIDEQSILRKEEIDFKGVVSRVKRGWPVIALSLLFWLIVGVIFQISYPPYYTAKTTILTHDPSGPADPSRLVTGEKIYRNTESYYFNNQRLVFSSYPLIDKAINKTGLVRYIKSGLIDREIYGTSPIRVELDSTYMSFARFETPYETPFYVNFNNFDTYSIKAEGAYLEGEAEFEFEGNFQFGEWVTFDKMKFRLLANDTLANPNIGLKHDIFEDEFGFILIDKVSYITNIAAALEVVDEDIESTVFTASLSGKSAARQLAFLSALGEAFMDDHLTQKTQTLRMALQFLEEEIAKTAEQLEDSEDSLKYFKSENAITSIQTEGSMLYKQEVKLQDQKVELVVRDKYFTYLEETLREGDDYSTLISPEAFGITDGLLVSLTQELVELQQDQKSLESQGAQNNPAYGQVKSAIEGNRATILNSVEGFRSSNRIKLGDIESRLREINANSKQFPKEQGELQKLERRFRINEALYTSLMEKKSNVELSLVSTISDFRIIEPAHLTTSRPIIPYAPITVTVAVLLGLVTGFGILLIIWLFRSGIDSSIEFKNLVGKTNVYGEIYDTNIRKPKVLEDYPHSRTANQFNGLIYNIGVKNPNATSLGIGSYNKGEGKSFVASLLAIQLANSGHKTLVIDANQRHPSIVKTFQMPLSDMELNSFDIEEAEQKATASAHNNVDVLLLGKVVFNNMEVDAFKKLITELGNTYDRIIIDTPPISNDSRALAVLNATDMPLVVMRRKLTSAQDISNLEELVKNGSLKALNVVLSGTFDYKGGLLSKTNPYLKNKPVSPIERVRNIFNRV
jgi:uncharacterized protein involved in exopolysaccharide biosynthesis/Mrp family chromosome partitioning ATPase